MGYPVPIGNTSKGLTFLLVLSSDHISGATGKTPTVTISKNGSAFAAPSGAVTELGNGLYTLAANATDANTLGPLFLHATAAACDPRDDAFDVVNYNPESVRVYSPPSGTTTVLVRTIISDMFMELGYSPGESIASADADFALGKMNRLFDNWNAIRDAVWASSFMSYTLTPNLAPHTIGPSSATFSLAQRPVDILGANLVLNNVTPNVNTTITMRDFQWWLSQGVPSLATSYPTDCYYEPNWPNGDLNFWPVPTTSWGVQLLARVLIANVSLQDDFWMPPGYRDAVTLTLAEMCAQGFGKVLSEDTKTMASQARARIFGNNVITPRLRTNDSGMPHSGSGLSSWNYLSGTGV